MSNFGFIETTLPAIHADCARRVLTGRRPRGRLLYSHRAIEQLVAHLLCATAPKDTAIAPASALDRWY